MTGWREGGWKKESAFEDDNNEAKMEKSLEHVRLNNRCRVVSMIILMFLTMLIHLVIEVVQIFEVVSLQILLVMFSKSIVKKGIHF